MAHLNALQKKHSSIETAIQEESHRPMPDFAQLTQMKKQKLAVKEEITRILSANPALRLNAS